jgi:hypothetical protein
LEHALLKSLLNKDFYDETRGNRCPEKLFTKDLQKVKRVIDQAMDNYQRDLSLDEIKGLFFANNPTLTTSQKQQYDLQFIRLNLPSQLVLTLQVKYLATCSDRLSVKR